MAHRKLAIFRRRTFTALSVLSLLLCVATLTLWPLSYTRFDGVYYTSDTLWCAVENVPACVQLLTNPVSLPKGGIPTFEHISSSSRNPRTPSVWEQFWPVARRFYGFGYLEIERLRCVSVPHWSLALLFAILPALHLRAFIRSRRRHRIGHCPRCGYDLRATPERCPECGTERVLATDAHR